jgi:hypothetical protein
LRCMCGPLPVTGRSHCLTFPTVLFLQFQIAMHSNPDVLTVRQHESATANSFLEAATRIVAQKQALNGQRCPERRRALAMAAAAPVTATAKRLKTSRYMGLVRFSSGHSTLCSSALPLFTASAQPRPFLQPSPRPDRHSTDTGRPARKGSQKESGAFPRGGSAAPGSPRRSSGTSSTFCRGLPSPPSPQKSGT